MQKFNFWIMTMIVVFLILLSKSGSTQNQTNYYILRDSLAAYYHSHPELMAGDENEYQAFIRWQYFWSTRVGDTSASNRASLSTYPQELLKFNSQRAFYNYSTPYVSNWHLLGPAQSKSQNLGIVTALFVDIYSDSTKNTIYAGTNASGLWKTIDGGGHWQNITDSILPSFGGINDVTGDPHHPGTIYISTTTNSAGIATYSYGIYKSTDGGINWMNVFPIIPSLSSSITYRIKVDPFNRNRLYALIDSLVFRSSDSGTNWDTIFGCKTCQGKLTPTYIWRHKNVRDIEFKPGDSTYLYICSDGFYVANQGSPDTWYEAEIWKTRNCLEQNHANILWNRLDTNFTPRIQATRYEIAVTPANSNAVYAVGTIKSGGCTGPFKLYQSTNNGSNWKCRLETCQDLLDANRLEFLISPTDTAVFYLGGEDMSNYQFGNSYPYSCNGDFHIDVRKAVIINGSAPGSRGRNDTLFAGNDGGVSRTFNGWKDCQNINGIGLAITQFYGFDLANITDSVILCGGTQDNEISLYKGNQWFNRNEGDNGNIVMNPIHHAMIFANTWNTGNGNYYICKTTDYWNGHITCTNKQTFNNEPAIPNKPLLGSSNNPNIYYTGYRNVYRTTNCGATWDSISSFMPSNGVDSGACLRAVAVAPSNDSIIFAAFETPDWYLNHKKFFKTTNAWNQHPTWTDLSANNSFLDNALGNRVITDIKISPTNPNKVWFSCGGFWDHRVNQSIDGGVTWTDISAGLPNLPVHRLAYMKGSNDGLFAATDGGVFYKDSAMAGWVPFNTNLPNPIVTDIHINDSTQKIYISTFGRGIWESDLLCATSGDSIVIASNQQQTWENDSVMNGNIVIDSGAILTIKSRVSFPPTGKIIVKRGATLTVDGGTLTSRCFQMWKGIELWGNSALPQTPTYRQGSVGLKNNAIIENARNAISTCRSDSRDSIMWDYTGGIIQAINSTFRNNHKAVAFLTYPYTSMSSFSNCKFEINCYMAPSFPGALNEFVSLLDIDGVRFWGCDFQDTLNLYAYPTERGVGIYSIDGGFRVDQGCFTKVQPCTNYKPTTFTGLYYGIKALGVDETKTISINKSVFIENRRGVYLSLTQNPIITSNIFYVMQLDKVYAPDTLKNYGIYLDHCTGYKVQENNVRGWLQSFNNPVTIGLVVNNSGGYKNEIYNNYIHGLKYGAIAQNINRDTAGIGLCIKCNHFRNNSYDISVTVDRNGGGIAHYQGSAEDTITAPAGNSFSPEHTGGVTDYYNSGSSIIYYYGNQNSTNLRIRPDYHSPSPAVSLILNDQHYDSTYSCPSHLLNNSNQDPEHLKNQLQAQRSIIYTNQTTLDSLIDGGSTQATNDTIFFSTPPKAADVRQNLLTKSPYLSDTVMKSAILKEDVLPNEMIRDVLVANPQSAKAEDVMSTLNNRFIPMPDSMMAEILTGQTMTSLKENKEALISHHSISASGLLDDIVRIYRLDSTQTHAHDSILAILQQENTIESKYSLAFEFLKTHDTALVNSTLNGIPISFSLTSVQQKTWQDYKDYFGVLKSLRSAHQSIKMLRQNQIAVLRTLDSTASEPIKMMAKNMLIGYGMVTYNEPILLPDDTKSLPCPTSYHISHSPDRSYMKIYPVPASSYVIIEYKYATNFSDKAQIEFIIHNANGKSIETIYTNKNQDQLFLNTLSYPSGLYVCTMKIKGKNIESDKFTIAY